MQNMYDRTYRLDKVFKDVIGAKNRAKQNKVRLLVEKTGMPESVVSTICDVLTLETIDYYIEHPQEFKELRIQDVLRISKEFKSLLRYQKIRNQNN